MADTANKRQVNILLPPIIIKLMTELKTARQEELGFEMSLGDYLTGLLKDAARKQGIKLPVKPKGGK